jgi:hypothetical protein
LLVDTVIEIKIEIVVIVACGPGRQLAVPAAASMHASHPTMAAAATKFGDMSPVIILIC